MRLQAAEITFTQINATFSLKGIGYMKTGREGEEGGRDGGGGEERWRRGGLEGAFGDVSLSALVGFSVPSLRKP